MQTLKPADGSRQFRGQGQSVSGVKDNKETGEGKGGKAQDVKDAPFKSQDEVSISDPLQAIFEEMDEHLKDILEDNPRFRRLVLERRDGSKKKEALELAPMALYANAKAFAGDENHQRLAEEDPQFAEFYNKVDRLVKVTGQALSQAQENLRQTNTLNYTRPYGLA